MITINAARMPGRINEYEVADDATVQDVLNAAGLSADGFDIRIDGSEGAPADSVSDGQTVLLVRKVKGNERAPEVMISLIDGRPYAVYAD